MSQLLSQLLPLFLNNLLPIFLAAGSGYLLSRYTEVNPRSLSQVIFYIFSPCLIFSLLTQSKLDNGNIVYMMLASGSAILLVGAIAWLGCRLLRLSHQEMLSVLLTSMFMNAGNFGLPVVLFAFGDAALGFASLFFVTSATLAYTLGVVIVSTGSSSLRQALVSLVKLPTLYALFVALVFLNTHWAVPLPLDRTVTLLGNASIPAMLVLLGMQLHKASFAGKEKSLALSAAMRLLVAPAIAALVIAAFGIAGPARQAVITEAAMPTAVLATMLATEYNIEPSLVTATVFLTTLLCPLTITPLLAYLGA